MVTALQKISGTTNLYVALKTTRSQIHTQNNTNAASAVMSTSFSDINVETKMNSFVQLPVKVLTIDII